MERTLAGLLLLLFVATSVHGTLDDCVVLAPNIVRLGTEETILVVNRGDSKYVTLQAQDIPARLNTYLQETVHLERDEVRPVKLSINTHQLNREDITSARYIALSLKCGSIYRKEVRLLVSERSGYLFLQTDKPIYTPKQTVRIRFVAVRENLTSVDGRFNLEIKNPQDIVTYKTSLEGNDTGMFSHTYDFPRSPLLGEWTVAVSYGPHPDQMAEVKFKVDEYVLPTFSVNLTVPTVILSHQEAVTGTVTARYVYGKPVEGSAVFRFKIKNEAGSEREIGSVSHRELVDGKASFSIPTRDMKMPRSQRWAPMVRGNRLVVEVIVMDGATSKRESAIDDSAIFATSPYIISFKSTPRDFRPGTTAIVVAQVEHPNSMPAPRVRTEITVVDEREQRISVDDNYSITDDDGKAVFFIETERHHKRLKCKVRTADPMYQRHQQEESIITLEPYESLTDATLALKRFDTRRRYQVGDKFEAHVTVMPRDMYPVYYVVLSRGRVEQYGNVAPGMPLSFSLTANMSPLSRILVYGFHGGHLLADALAFHVQDTCTATSQIEIETAFKTHEPGERGALRVRGTGGTRVGILAVDEAVYVLRKKDLLTRNKLFAALRSHDLGCGPGGGLNSEAVIANSGVVIISRHLAENPGGADSSCEARQRRRRNTMMRSRASHTDPYLQKCCSLGQRRDKHNRSCQTRAAIVREFLRNKAQGDLCADAFYRCCRNLHAERPPLMGSSAAPGADGSPGPPDRGRVNPKGPYDEASEEEDFDDESIFLRHNFQETWLFEDKIIPVEGVAEFRSSLPHSITTWSVQAVSVSPEGGVCVAEPKEVHSFRNVFLQVSLPYKVVRNEQIEVLATVYNYGHSSLRGNVFMYGVDGLCTGAAAGERTERQRVSVAANSATSVTFPIVPLREGEFKLQVIIISTRGRDKVEKKLYVVPEGITVEKSISVAIDPTNERRRKTRSVRGDRFQDSLDPAARVQVIAVNTRLPPDALPDTKQCSVSVIGDKLGPAVHTTLDNLETLITMPRGCGEQNMMLMAPTLYTLDYLKKKGSMNETVEETAYKYLRTGYERQLTYRQENGAFSAFRHRASSVWLTAFVMRVFCRARTYVSIDQTVIDSGMQWLASKQLADGSFEELKPIMHKSMLGGVRGKIPMTAFVLLTLYECLGATANEVLGATTNRAEHFLSQRLYDVHEPYIAALVAYSLSLSGSPRAKDALDILKERLYFDADMNTRSTGEEASALVVEGSSYALLALLKHGDIDLSNTIVNWLNMHRTASGSFQSTQDTVVALQALSEYALQTRDPYLDLMCNITLSNKQDFKESIRVRRDNAAILQQLDLADVTGKMYVSASGVGSGLLSVKLQYNIMVAPEVLCKFNITVKADVHRPAPQREDRNLDFPPELLGDLGLDFDRRRRSPSWNRDFTIRTRPTQSWARSPASLPLRLNPRDRVGASMDSTPEEVPISPRRGLSKLTYDIEVCTRYLGDGDSNMAVIDVGLFSGFEPIKEDLEKLREDKIIDKHDVQDKHIVLYFEKIPSDRRTCVTFRTERKYVVNNVQAAAVKVYDYYNPMHSCSQLYAPALTSPLLKIICQGAQCQCAEDGCPLKEPFASLRRVNNSAARELLRNIVCKQHDFVWKGQVVENKQTNGFRRITFRISKVIMEGEESADEMHGYDRELISRDHCKEADLLIGHHYYIFGHDREPFEDNHGIISRRYHLDQGTKLFWDDVQNPDYRKLGATFQWLSSGFMRQRGCEVKPS